MHESDMGKHCFCFGADPSDKLIKLGGQENHRTDLAIDMTASLIALCADGVCAQIGSALERRPGGRSRATPAGLLGPRASAAMTARLVSLALPALRPCRQLAVSQDQSPSLPAKR